MATPEPEKHEPKSGEPAAYEAPRLRRLGRIQDVTRGTGSLPGSFGPETSDVSLFGSFSGQQVEAILNRQKKDGPGW